MHASLEYMNDYVIGSGAILTPGPHATIAGASLHAQTEPALAAGIKAALVDFTSGAQSELSQVVIFVTGFDARRFEEGVSAPLLARRSCSLADILAYLARAAVTDEVHVFADWIPDDELVTSAAAHGVTLVAHPLRTIRQAALISSQRRQRWFAAHAA